MHKILIIGYVWPEPASSAAGSRMLQLIQCFLAHHAAVTFASAAKPSNHMIDLASIGVGQATIELNCSSFDTFIGELQPDLVLFDRFMIEEQFGWRVAQQCPDALRILDTEDLHCLRHARHKALKSGREITHSDLNSDLAIREIAAILRCDLSLMISSYEMELLSTHYGVKPELLLHLPFMLEPTTLKDYPAFSEREGYISIGNFRHAPNWDAVLYLKNTLWPRIRQLQPQARLSIYGAYPPPKATQLHNPAQGFFVEGWANDAQQVMQAARICLAPLRFGAGLKGKLIDAMCCGTPSITTTVGAEAMHADLPWGGVITDQAEDFAGQAVELYHSPETWQEAQQKGQTIINQLYQVSQLRDRLLNRLLELQQTLQQHRLNNFTGAMLRHHSMQSTRYMAQWIEAKNQK